MVCRLTHVFYTQVVTPIIAIKLPAALEKFVASQVREGRYRSREAVIIAAVLHQKRRSEQLGWVRTEIQNGLDSGPAGELDIDPARASSARRSCLPGARLIPPHWQQQTVAGADQMRPC
jgi:putative addiction module CopG family antidote